MTVSPCEFPPRVLIICVLSAISRTYNIFFVLVLSPLIKSPYKTCFLNIPYFMQVRKHFDAEKIRKKGWFSGILSISFKENVNGKTISPEAITPLLAWSLPAWCRG